MTSYIMQNRPSWDEYFTQIVQVTSKRSCQRLQVGCLIVRDNRIISQGYNGFLPGCQHVSVVRDGHEQATIHAEQMLSLIVLNVVFVVMIVLHILHIILV